MLTRNDTRVQSLVPVTALLSVAREDEQRVVDPEREPHPGEHVHDEDGELELGRDERRQAERDGDRDEGEDERQPGRNEGAEDEHEDEQGGREPETELAVLEVLKRG